MKAIHEALDLRPDGLCHPHLSNQLNILLLQQNNDVCNILQLERKEEMLAEVGFEPTPSK